MKKIKKVLAFILSLCMLLNVSPLEAYAENGSGGGGTSSLSLESGVQYIVPLIFYQNTGNLQTGNLYGSGGEMWSKGRSKQRKNKKIERGCNTKYYNLFTII